MKRRNLKQASRQPIRASASAHLGPKACLQRHVHSVMGLLRARIGSLCHCLAASISQHNAGLCCMCTSHEVSDSPAAHGQLLSCMNTGGRALLQVQACWGDHCQQMPTLRSISPSLDQGLD